MYLLTHNSMAIFVQELNLLSREFCVHVSSPRKAVDATGGRREDFQ